MHPCLPNASATVSGQRPAHGIACLLEVAQQGERVDPLLDRQDLAPSVRNPSPRPRGLATFHTPTDARYQGEERSGDRGSTVLTGEKCNAGAGWAWRVIDSQMAGGYSPLDFSPFRRFVLGFWESGRERGGEVYAESRVEGSTRLAADQIRRPESGKAWR
jgi:hypothetical protein